MLWWLAETTLVAAALALAASLAARLRVPGFGPAARHALWLVVLIKLVTPPLVSAPWAVPVPVASERVSSTETPVVAARDQGLEDSTPATLTMTRDAPVPPDFELPTARLVRMLVVGVESSRPRESTLPERSRAADPGPVVTSSRATPAVPRSTFRSRLDPAAAGRWLLIAWVAASAVVALVQAARIVRFARRLRSAVPAPGWLVNETVRLAARMGVRAPDALVVPGLGVPMLWCLGRPKLLLPAHLVQTFGLERWRGVLAHELAHLRRADPWVGRLALVAGLAWWWNPVYWLARRRLDAEAELACDAWVVWALPDDRVVYAGTMLDICETLCQRMAPPLAPALGGSDPGRLFERRLTMILNDRVPCRLTWRGLIAPGLLVLIGLPSWTVAARAQKDDPKPDKPAAVKPTEKGERIEFFIGEDGKPVVIKGGKGTITKDGKTFNFVIVGDKDKGKPGEVKVGTQIRIIGVDDKDKGKSSEAKAGTATVTPDGKTIEIRVLGDGKPVDDATIKEKVKAAHEQAKAHIEAIRAKAKADVDKARAEVDKTANVLKKAKAALKEADSDDRPDAERAVNKANAAFEKALLALHDAEKAAGAAAKAQVRVEVRQEIRETIDDPRIAELKAGLDQATAILRMTERLARNPDDPAIQLGKKRVEALQRQIEALKAEQAAKQADKGPDGKETQRVYIRRMIPEGSDGKDLGKFEVRVVPKDGQADKKGDLEVKVKPKKKHEGEFDIDIKIEELSKLFSADSELMKGLESLGPDLEKKLKEKLGPGTKFDEKVKGLGKKLGEELKEHLGPGSDFDQAMKELAKSLEETLGPGSDFEKKIKGFAGDVEAKVKETPRGKDEAEVKVKPEEVKPEPKAPSATPARPDRPRIPARARALEQRRKALEARIKALDEELKKLELEENAGDYDPVKPVKPLERR